MFFGLIALIIPIPQAYANCSDQWTDRFFEFQDQAHTAETVGEIGFGAAAAGPLVFWLVALPTPLAGVVAIAGGSAFVAGYTTEAIKVLQFRHAQKTLSLFTESYNDGVIFAPTVDSKTCSRTDGLNSLSFVPCSTVEAIHQEARTEFLKLVQKDSSNATMDSVFTMLDQMNLNGSLCEHRRIPTRNRLAKLIARSLGN